MRKLIINESEKSQIMSLYGNVNEDITNDIVITDWLSPDEKYVVFLDELFDIKNKVNLGNIWEDYNTLKTFLQHTFLTSDLPKQLKENAESVLNNKLLLEGKQNLNELKSATKLLFNEGLISNFKDWAVKTGKSTIDGFVEFVKKTYKGASSLINNISKGEWKEVFNLLKKGVLYLARKLRSAMYHPVGLIIDAILFASQIGIGFQKIAWGIIVALDVYEIISGNYEEQLPMWQRLLFLGVDILGFVFVGAAAKSAKTIIAGKDLKTIAESPSGRNLLTKIVEGIKKVPEMLSKTSKFLKERYPVGSKFITNILGGLGNILKSLVKTISDVLSIPNKLLNKVIPGQSKLSKGVRAGVGTTAIVGGVGAYEENQLEKEKQMMGGFNDVKFDFSKSL